MQIKSNHSIAQFMRIKRESPIHLRKNLKEDVSQNTFYARFVNFNMEVCRLRYPLNSTGIPIKVNSLLKLFSD